MPLKLQVGLAKKVGLPDYGSIGTSCSLELELSSTLLQHDPDAFRQQVHLAYAACAQAVNDELVRQQGQDASSPASDTQATNGNTNGHAHGNGNRASTKQRDYAQQLASQVRGLGARRLEALAQKMFGKPLADLSSLDASGLIDVLKDIKAGKVDLDAALNGAAL